MDASGENDEGAMLLCNVLCFPGPACLVKQKSGRDRSLKRARNFLVEAPPRFQWTVLTVLALGSPSLLNLS